jgi:hypothetical protein
MCASKWLKKQDVKARQLQEQDSFRRRQEKLKENQRRSPASRKKQMSQQALQHIDINSQPSTHWHQQPKAAPKQDSYGHKNIHRPTNSPNKSSEPNKMDEEKRKDLNCHKQEWEGIHWHSEQNIQVLLPVIHQPTNHSSLASSKAIQGNLAIT